MFTKHSKRITLVISSLSGGGAERVMSHLANYWAENGKDITIITLDSVESDFYTLHPHVKRIAMGLMKPSKGSLQAVINNFTRLKLLRQKIKYSNPDCIISFTDIMNIKTLISCTGLKIPIIVSERTDPRKHHIGPVWSCLRRIMYPKSNAVVVQSSNVSNWAKEFLNDELVNIIPNPIFLDGYRAGMERSRDTDRKVIAMGRLVPEKGFDLLLHAFARCIEIHKNWSLVILGEGPMRNELEALSRKLNVEAKVQMMGRINRPFEQLDKSDLFVLSSHYEGFPNALLEAMACGLPVISTDCPSGPNEIISHNIDGLLIEPNSIDALADAMDHLMSNESERKRLATKSIEVNSRFSIDRVSRMWEELIHKVSI
jgi:GalNAc-alpha-(1->4)-GalNAc-alpha-(1->3)-diNAcBac-PP-undecaprenol alpha-1,4-N-acetyl-D-galactosaminyltransferase